MRLNCVLSSEPRGVPSYNDSGSEVDKGVGVDLQVFIPTFLSNPRHIFLELKLTHLETS